MCKVKYFESCKTGGDVISKFAEIMPSIPTNEFDTLCSQFKGAWLRNRGYARSLRGKVYEETCKVTADDMLATMLELLGMDNVHIEIRGDWIWVSGKTEAHKADLFNLGLRQKSGTNKWYWSKRAAMNIKEYYRKKAQREKRAAAKAAKAEKTA